MSKNTQQEPLSDRLEELRALRDEIRVNLHLASMDLRDEWANLERRLPQAATIASELKEATVEVAQQLGTELRNFRDRVLSSTSHSRR
jgi:hypothetical protein